MARPRVRRLELQALCHATEAPEKVREALLNLLPEELRGRANVEETIMKGHYGNPIRLLRIILAENDAERTLKWLFSKMSRDDLRLLELSLERRMDKGGHLYLRLDKQDAYMGRVRITGGGDVVRLAASIRGKPIEAIRRLASIEQ